MSKRGLRVAVARMTVAVWLSGGGPCVAQTLSAPTEQQIQSAIDLGRADKIPTIKLNSFAGDFDVLIEGPVARIATAASAATRRYKPFAMRDVTPEMRAPLYVVSLQRRTDSRAFGPIQNVVLQPKGSTSVETAIQPLKQLGETASFDRLPEGEFDVIVVLVSEQQRYGVSLKDRARLEYPFGGPPETASPLMADVAAGRARVVGGQPLRLSVQGDGQRHADAVLVLEDELRAAGVVPVVVQHSEQYDYMIILGEGRDAASAIALDSQGNVVAQAVRSALTQRGAVEGASRELGKKLAARSR